jgi:hypothetical protein
MEETPMKETLKKLLTKKAAAVVCGVAICLGVCDLTIADKSHLQPVVDSVRSTVSETVDSILGKDVEETKVLIQ